MPEQDKSYGEDVWDNFKTYGVGVSTGLLDVPRYSALLFNSLSRYGEEKLKAADEINAAFDSIMPVSWAALANENPIANSIGNVVGDSILGGMASPSISLAKHLSRFGNWTAKNPKLAGGLRAGGFASAFEGGVEPSIDYLNSK